MKRIHLFIRLALFFLSIASCREEDPLSATGDATPVRLCVVADNFVSTAGTTRATEEGYVTKFATGDRIGIFAVSATVGVLDKNIPYKYSGTAWVPVDAANTMHRYDNYLDDVTYFAYYPYSADMDDKKSEQEIIDAFTPKTDQSTYANYTASDLMTGAGTLAKTGDAYTITFQLAHRMSLLVLCPDPYTYVYAAPVGAGYEYHPESGIRGTVTGAKINNVTACAMEDGTYRLIVKPGTMNVPLEYALDGTTTSHTFTGQALTGGTYRQFNLGHIVKTKEREFTLGDFYYYDGTHAYLIPGDDNLTIKKQQAACIGIVCSKDVSRIGDGAKTVLAGKGVTSPHGLVMALTNASSNCKWGDNSIDENSNGSEGEPFFQNTNMFYQNVNGYDETHWIIDNKNNGATLKNAYAAFYYADLYGKTEGGTARYAAPVANTTGWFIPSIGQWWDIFSYWGGEGLKTELDKKKNTAGDIKMSSGGITVLNNINTYLNKISGATLFNYNSDTYYWASSEYSTTHACNVICFASGAFGLYLSHKYYNNRRVRCIFAF